MRKSIVLTSFLLLFAATLVAQPSPQVESLDSARAPFATTSVVGETGPAEKALPIRAGLSTPSAVPGALLRIADFTGQGGCRMKAAFRRDLSAGDRDWLESTDRVLVSADVSGQNELAYDDLLGKALDEPSIEPMFGGCLFECRSFAAYCSSYCAELGAHGCADCTPLSAPECACTICQCKPSPANCDDNPCL